MSLLKSVSYSAHGVDHEVVNNGSGERRFRRNRVILCKFQHFILPRARRLHQTAPARDQLIAIVLALP